MENGKRQNLCRFPDNLSAFMAFQRNSQKPVGFTADVRVSEPTSSPSRCESLLSMWHLWLRTEATKHQDTKQDAKKSELAALPPQTQ